MATYTALNVLSSAVEEPKYNQFGLITEIYTVAMPVTLSAGDTVNGPILPAGCYLYDVVLDSTALDSNATPTIVLEAGYTGSLAAFIAASTVAQHGGRQVSNVAGTLGFTASTPTQLLVTVATVAATKAAGTLRIAFTYTASP